MGQHAAMYSSATWQALRAAQLRAHPLCCLCQQRGLHTPATVVDHIQPHRGSWALFASPANLQSLCRTCHNSAKQRAERRGGPTPGANAQGVPLCNTHGWANYTGAAPAPAPTPPKRRG